MSVGFGQFPVLTRNGNLVRDIEILLYVLTYVCFHFNVFLDTFQKNVRLSSHQFGVIVCTDRILSDHNIRNAQHVIHYSLPEGPRAFIFRFSSSIERYPNFVSDEV